MTDNEIKLANSLRLKIKRGKNTEVIEILEKLGVNCVIHDIGTPLNVACIFKNRDIAEYCITKGADLNNRDIYTDTPLITCCKNGDTDIAKLLIENGANINAKNRYDRTAIARFISDNHTNLNFIEYLLQKGADPTIYEQYSEGDPRISTFTAYDYAVKEIKNPELIKLLDKYTK
ncbi:MAG: ankyrin repeat domain-containing protein [Bacteroidales bacterium]|jgi:ankyrin repeat protein|nr:ankyrin repeat domain-containing protein [Bacteroidales bacterium]